MKIELLFVGKTSERFLTEGIEIYSEKLKHYLQVEIIIIPPSKAKARSKGEESEAILRRINPGDYVVLLDESGDQLSSVDLSKQIQKWMNQSFKKIVIITGGAYGVDQSLLKRADFLWSFSQLTFTHQMIRLVLLEQLYRAMTIIKGESYHHD
jgi:23S rRNA (pseudouridine1915-N3)-methyltransferase